jgi:protoheme IX farnesyltransferase
MSRNDQSRIAAVALPLPDAGAVQDFGLSDRLSAFVTLTKPRIATMVVISAGVGFLLATQDGLNIARLVAALIGIGLSGAASSILNQWLEQKTDALMARTAERPLPAGRVTSREALTAGVVLTFVSIAWLAATVNLLTAMLTAATCLMYVGVYTPLKPRTALCTAIGAIPGAMPLVLGWTAGGGELSWEAFALFSILYVWQFPHFLAIAWIYQHQYRGAGLKMLPADGRSPLLVGLSAVGYAAALIPVSLWARSVGLAGDAYALCAVILGVWYLAGSVRFAVEPTSTSARKLLWTSLAHLPMLLAALTIDHVRLLQ